MKIIIVTQNAPMYLASFLDGFFKLLSKTHHKVENIVVLSPYFKNSFFEEVKHRYNFYGFINFFKMICYIKKNKILAFVFNIYPSIGCYSVNNILKKHRLKKYETASINSKIFIDYIKTNHIDLVVSLAASQIFKKEILNTPLKGCINYHTALLPKYRGRQPLFWALLNDDEVGISIHEMDEKLDNGPIIIQKKVPLNPNETLHSLYLKTIKIGPGLVMEAIEKIDNNCEDRIENNSSYATQYSFPSKGDARLFVSKGNFFF